MEKAEILQLMSLLLEVPDEENEESQFKQILDLLVSDSSSSSESSASEFDVEEHPKGLSFVKIIDSFSDKAFKSHVRLERLTVEYLISKYTQYALSTNLHRARGGRHMIDTRTTLYIYVWYVSNTLTYKQLANLFGVSKSTAWIAVRRVASWLVKTSNEYIKWPQGAAAEQTMAKFEQKNRMPGIIGAIDCTHIEIKAPKLNKECYFDGNQTYSLVLQGIVDANKRFINITCGEPGSLHDSRVLRRSDIYARAHTNYYDLFPNESYVIGDLAYPATNWLVPPFQDCGNMTKAQLNFNKIHLANRIVVENAFALLKGRFRRLLKLTEQTKLPSLTNIIVSVCVLHNICIDHNDCYSGNLSELTNYTLPEEINSTNLVSERLVDRRSILFNYLREHNII